MPWIKTTDELPPDEWFFLPDPRLILAIHNFFNSDVPDLDIMRSGFSKRKFIDHVLYWRWINPLPDEIVALMEEERLERYLAGERAEHGVYGGDTYKDADEAFRREIQAQIAEQDRLKRVRFENWVAAGKPTLA